jgi:hypothetical protein
MYGQVDASPTLFQANVIEDFPCVEEVTSTDTRGDIPECDLAGTRPLKKQAQ